MSDDIAAVLENAADYIDDHGWIQGEYMVGESCCAEGAICRVVNTLTDNGQLRWVPGDCSDVAVGALADYLSDSSRVRPSDAWEFVARWNDHVSRTWAEVVATLRGAAAAERAKAATP